MPSPFHIRGRYSLLRTVRPGSNDPEMPGPPGVTGGLPAARRPNPFLIRSSIGDTYYASWTLFLSSSSRPACKTISGVMSLMQRWSVGHCFLWQGGEGRACRRTVVFSKFDAVEAGAVGTLFTP